MEKQFSPLLFLLICSGFSIVNGAEDCPNLSINNEWGEGWDGSIMFELDHSTSGWVVHLTFDIPITNLDCWQATVSSTDKKTFTLTNLEWDSDYQDGAHVELHIQPHYTTRPYLIAADIDGQDICGGTPTSTSRPTTSTAKTTTPSPTPDDDCSEIVDSVDNGDDTDFIINITPEVNVNHWTVVVEFLSAVASVTTPLADVTGSGKMWILKSKSWDGELTAGDTFQLSLNVVHGSGKPSIVDVTFNEAGICKEFTTAPTTQTTTAQSDIYHPDHTAKYPYGEVLQQSLLFYEAQRSGPLPPDNRVPWRGDSGMTDEILGGYMDAGDHVKFGFPMASFTTILAWGGINFKSGYDKAGQTEWLAECLKWATDYFIACHKSDFEYIGQIGDGYADHAYWGRPEEMTMARPSFSITADKPGSELAGETAAALAASSIFFRSIGDLEYADKCLSHAKKLFEFADTYRGDYTEAIPAADFYNDWGGYNDEIAWAAAWVAMATKDPADIATAESKYVELGIPSANPGEISWDDKNAMVFLVMYELTGKDEYKKQVEDFLDFAFSADRTGKGLIWIPSSEWGSLRYAANFAMFATQAVYSGIYEEKSFNFAESQINYILGDAGRSYVVGWGNNPPERCHHRGASCPNRPAPCGWNDKDKPDPNPQILHGALVGGPDRNDNYIDDRNNFAMTEVADDYNAGFQSALAGLNAIFES